MSSASSRDRDDVLAATIASAALIAQQVAGKATRDALFLAEFHVSSLPAMMIVGAALSLVAAFVAGRALFTFGPRRVVRAAFAINALAFAIEFLASFSSRATLAVAVYVQIALLGATAISIFWSHVNEQFDPHAAKGAVARIAGGGTLGGVIGGVIGWRIAEVTSVRAMLVALALLNATALWAIARVGRARPSRPVDPAPSNPPTLVGGGVRRLPVDRYLVTLGVMVAIVAAIDAVVDFAFAAEAHRRMPSGRELMAFFSVFHTVVGISTFLAQTTLSRRTLERLGIAGTIALFPMVIGVAALVALRAPALWAIVLLRGAGAVVANSLWRSGYELLYTPVAQAKKRPLKTLIDVGCDRLGTALGSGAVLLLLASSDVPLVPLLMVVLLLAVLALVVARSLHVGYVTALEESLRTGALALDDDVVDATTRRTIDAARAIDRARGVDVEARAPSSQRVTADPLLAAIADLRSSDRFAIQRALCAREDDPRLAPFVIPLLERDDVRAEATVWLRRVAPRIAGQLVDALVDREIEPSVRRRIPRVVRGVPSQVVAEGLVRGLSDPIFEVRYECGAALARMVEKEYPVRVPTDAVLEAVRHEIVVERRFLDAEPFLDPPEDEADAPLFPAVLRDRASRGLEHVFTLLSVLLDREALRVAWRAIGSDDPALRGTAIEYLENVLPAEIRGALLPYVSGTARRRSARLDPDELAALARSEGLVARPSEA